MGFIVIIFVFRTCCCQISSLRRAHGSKTGPVLDARSTVWSELRMTVFIFGALDYRTQHLLLINTLVPFGHF